MFSTATQLLSLCLALRLAVADEFITPLYDFLSRPDIRSPRLQIDAYDPAGVAPGYIFLTPAARTDIAEGVDYNFGPAIYDNDGELVWSGYKPSLPKLAESMGFDVVEYENEPHLAYSTIGVSGMSHGEILDENYQLVREAIVGRTRENFFMNLRRDMHVFNVITPSSLAIPPPFDATESELRYWVKPDDPQTALLSATARRHLRSPALVCGQRIDWVHDFPFQEVALDGSGEVLFEWSPLDHIPVEETLICPGMKDNLNHDPELIGTNQGHPFDFVHRNAVDKLPDGNYVVSVRHMNTIYKISHIDGRILWRLGGGRWTDFEQFSRIPGVPLEFSGQHDIRVANDIEGADPEAGIIGLTLWDNANLRYDGEGASSDRSLGKTILVNEHLMTAELVSAFALPGNPLGTNQGSHQILPNGNHLLGGGNLASIAEYREDDGTTGDSPSLDELAHPNAREDLARPVFAAHFGGGPMNSYRARRYEWHGKPTARPDVLVYRRSCNVIPGGDRTFVYVSWNGATNVAWWTVWAAPKEGAADDEFREIARESRTGFETMIAIRPEASEDWLYGDEEVDDYEKLFLLEEQQIREVYVVAYNSAGQELDRSARVGVWVPREEDTLANKRITFEVTTAKRRRDLERRYRGGECGEHRCKPDFNYSWERATDCSAPDSNEALGWLLCESGECLVAE